MRDYTASIYRHTIPLNTRMIKIENLKGSRDRRIHHKATKSKETRSKILALASIKDSGKRWLINKILLVH